MAQYAQQSDLENAVGGAERLVQLADWNKDRVADADRITAALVAASGEINNYLAKQRLVPLALPYPQSVIDCCARIARYRMAGPRGMQTEDWRKEYDDDVTWLKAIASGEIKLDVDPQPEKASDRIDGFSERPASKDVSRAKLAGFR